MRISLVEDEPKIANFVERGLTEEGLAVDVDENGALVLELVNGKQKKIIYGDCFLV